MATNELEIEGKECIGPVEPNRRMLRLVRTAEIQKELRELLVGRELELIMDHQVR